VKTLIYKGDGVKYKGRGFVQITGRANYEKFAKYMNEQAIVSEPSIVAINMEYAFEAGGWYWENIGHVTATNENINLVADKDNILKVSQCINGRVKHPNGLEQRKKYVQIIKRIFEYDKKH